MVRPALARLVDCGTCPEFPQGDSEQRWTTVLQTIWGQPGQLSPTLLTISVLQHCAVLHEGHVTGSFRQAPV